MNNWKSKLEVEVGTYWFYGEVSFGAMGADRYEDAKHKPELILVKVKKIANGFIGVSGSQFINLEPFNKEGYGEGYVGYWKKANLPEAPEDFDKIFNL